VSAYLDQAVYALLTPARGVIDRHGDNGAHSCRSCGLPWPCFELGTAIGALDLVLRVHVAARNHPDDNPAPAGTMRTHRAADHRAQQTRPRPTGSASAADLTRHTGQ
jgi:hypothetical protein